MGKRCGRLSARDQGRSACCPPVGPLGTSALPVCPAIDWSRVDLVAQLCLVWFRRGLTACDRCRRRCAPVFQGSAVSAVGTPHSYIGGLYLGPPRGATTLARSPSSNLMLRGSPYRADDGVGSNPSSPRLRLVPRAFRRPVPRRRAGCSLFCGAHVTSQRSTTLWSSTFNSSVASHPSDSWCRKPRAAGSPTGRPAAVIPPAEASGLHSTSDGERSRPRCSAGSNWPP